MIQTLYTAKEKVENSRLPFKDSEQEQKVPVNKETEWPSFENYDAYGKSISRAARPIKPSQ